MLETPAEAQGSPRERDPDMADTLPLSANVSPSPATPQRGEVPPSPVGTRCSPPPLPQRTRDRRSWSLGDRMALHPEPPTTPQIRNGCVSIEDDILITEITQELSAMPQAGRTTTRLLDMSSPGFTPIRRSSALRTAVQSRLTRSRATSEASGHTGPTTHLLSPRKAADVQLVITRKWVILGDSNVGRMPTHDITDLQTDAFTDATFRHGAMLLDSATSSCKVEKMILAFGHNNRGQSKDTIIQQLRRMIYVAGQRFPNCEIIVPQVNFSPRLPLQEQTRLTELNTFIATLSEYIPMLPSDQFQMESESNNNKWSIETAKTMLDHWAAHLN
ncbi:hypothetical protein EYF80_060791 [Liparis tanakae]|uniref:Uncharacterized protein n=1 Tax=Liparis tanakae TaxID=230148 RepID=A0A4Z2EK99_9TELE|nr:hypothetical protein EYF80_060791 [Liparis tanakae]